MNGHLATYALLFALSAQSAFAANAIGYTVTSTRSGDTTKTGTSKVVASGDRVRVSALGVPPGEGILYDVLLRTDRSTVIALNTRNQTWYELEDASPFSLGSSYLFPGPNSRARNVRARLDPVTQEAGKQHHSGEIAYDVHVSYGGHDVKISCVAAFRVTTDDALERRLWVGRILPRTGYPEVDAELRKAESAMEGFPVELSLDATRKYEGGAPMVESVHIEVTGFTETTADPADFVRPADYREQKPVLGAPGVG